MAVIRNERKNHYTVVPNDALRTPTLSLQAKGLLALMLSYPDDWHYNLSHLEDLSTNGRDAHRGALKELIKAGYAEWRTVHNVDGTLTGRELVVSDEPLRRGTESQADGDRAPDKPSHGDTVGLKNRRTGKPSDGKSDTTKDLSLTKEQEERKTQPTVQKRFDPLEVDLPANVSRDVWRDFVAYRRERRLPITPTHTRRLLERLSAAGADADAMLLQSIENGWQGVFDLKDRAQRAEPHVRAAQQATSLLAHLEGRRAS